MDNEGEMNNLITTSQGEQDFQEGGNIVSFYNRPVGGGVTRGSYNIHIHVYELLHLPPQFPVSGARLKFNISQLYCT